MGQVLNTTMGLERESKAAAVRIPGGAEQAKAAVICGCIGVVAEISYEALKKRKDQGWVKELIDNPGMQHTLILFWHFYHRQEV